MENKDSSPDELMAITVIALSLASQEISSLTGEPVSCVRDRMMAKAFCQFRSMTIQDAIGFCSELKNGG